MLQLPFLKNEWLDSLQKLQKQWGGKLNEGLRDAEDGLPHYASLTSQIGTHKIYLAREENISTSLMIYFWGDWGLKLILRKEDIHDRFLKSLGLEYELTMEGNEINIIAFNKQFLIKGEPSELIKAFLSDSKNRDLISGMNDFEMLNIKDGVFRIIYEFDSADRIRPENLADLVNAAIKFIEAIEADKAIPKLVREKFVPPPPKKPFSLDFNNRKTVFAVLFGEFLLLGIFGNSVAGYFLVYLNTHEVGYLNAAILLLIIFVAPLLVMVFLTARRLLVLSMIDTCGVTLDSTNIKPGDEISFAVGLSSKMSIRVKKITLTFLNDIKEYVGSNTSKVTCAYSMNYILAEGLIMEQGRPYVFKGRMAIPADAVPSGLLEGKVKKSVINALDIPEYTGRESTWVYRVDVRIDYLPDYYFEHEFKVSPSGSASGDA